LNKTGRCVVRSITSIIEKALADARILDERLGEQPAWYPSVVSMGCDRKSILERHGVEGTPHDTQTLRKFWMGSSIHNALQALVSGALKDDDVQFIGNELSVRNDEYKLAGRIDTLVKVDNVVEAWEYKSAASASFRYTDFPKKEHIFQVGVYLAFPAKSEDGTVCPLPKQARIIYFSKDDAAVQEYIITPDYEFDGVPLLDHVKQVLLSLEAKYTDYKSDGTLPPVLPKVTKQLKSGPKVEYDWRCRYCPYFGVVCLPEEWDENETER